MVRELRNECDIGENLDVHLQDLVFCPVVARRTLQRWNVQGHADYPPQRARAALLTIRIYGVELQHFAAVGEHGALAVRKHLLAVVTYDAQVDHVADGFRKAGRSLRRASHSR